ncbi:hypothetical protein QP445_13685, partial [Micrococcus luteus]|nr:hypothetical protein [Micrococcus luteus]
MLIILKLFAVDNDYHYDKCFLMLAVIFNVVNKWNEYSPIIAFTVFPQQEVVQLCFSLGQNSQPKTSGL